MFNILLILQVLLCLAIIFLVLLQQGKGADMGAVFGATNNYSASGSGNPLAKATTIIAIAFMVVSILLTKAYVAGGRVTVPQQQAAPSATDMLKGSIMGEEAVQVTPAQEVQENNNEVVVEEQTEKQVTEEVPAVQVDMAPTAEAPVETQPEQPVQE